MTDVQRTLREIEDRKIEILLEIGSTNREYSTTMKDLEDEYSLLDAEHFSLRLEMMRSRKKKDVG
jgi:hypothetical protein